MIIFLFLFVCLVAQSCSAQQQEMDMYDAYYWNSLIGRGVNLGNALEAPIEGDWGVRLKEEYFDLIAEAGFDSIRIPVRWSTHTEADSPYSIEQQFLARVDWAVNQALSRKLVVIINVHHYGEMLDSPEAHKERFLAIWKQLARHYKDYSDLLYFELLNEPGGNLTSTLWNEYVTEAIKIIREDNPIRAIIVGPTQWNSISQLNNLKLPHNEKNVIVTIHYYEPFRFTHQGASWANNSEEWIGTTWLGTEAQKSQIESQLDRAAHWGWDNKRPLFLGEFGSYSKAENISRLRWTEFVRAEAEKRRISWAYWEFCAGFGIYDKSKSRWKQDLLYTLIPNSQ